MNVGDRFGRYAALSLLAVCLGCGGADGPPRYDVQGAVTFDGQPVPAGRIVFEPDASQGNRGPASYAEIEQGRYSTESGKGTVGGPHRVRISGFDGVSQGELIEGRPLFREYQTTVDLPRETTTHDFVVPTEAP